MRQQFMTEPQPPSKLNPEINADVDKVILHALAKKPEERFALVSNFANAFQQALQYTKQQTSLQPILEPTIYVASGPLTPNPEMVTPKVLASTNTLHPEPIIDKVEYMLPPPPPPVKSTSQKTHTRAFVLIALALILVLSSIIGIATYQNHVYQVNAYATDTANSATSQAQQDQTNATATATVVAANPYPSYLAGSPGKLALYDSLAHEDNWMSGKDSASGDSCQFSNGTYHITSSKTNTFFPCPSTGGDVKNFAFESLFLLVIIATQPR